MSTIADSLIPAEESTFNRPGFWDFGGSVDIGGGVLLLDSDGAYIGKAVLTPGQKYVVQGDLASLNASNLHVGNIITGSGSGPQSKIISSPGPFAFEMTADDAFFGAIVNGGTAILNSLQVYPVDAYATPPTPTPPAPKRKSVLPLLIGLGVVWAIFRK
jgi:hypothetical protein